MATMTAEQLVHINRLFVDKKLSVDQATKLIDTGLLADLCDANLDVMDRLAFRTMCGLGPLNADGFPVWKTIKLGTGLRTADEFRKALTGGGFKIGDWGNDILGQPAFTAATDISEVDLVNVSPRELGFKKNSTYKKICAKAKSMGLDYCPSEAGPQLRLQYTDQPMREWVLVAMEAIVDSDGNLGIFNVERNGEGQWLDGDRGNPDFVWFPDFRFVFVRRKK